MKANVNYCWESDVYNRVEAERAMRDEAQQEPDGDKGTWIPGTVPGFLQEILVINAVVLIIKGFPVN